MNPLIRRAVLVLMTLQGAASVLAAASWLTTRVDDPNAVYLEAPAFDVRGDGVADDSAAIQAAIDRAATGHAGESIVFIPSGRYRLTRTIFIWSGVRVYGYGETRPVFVLGDNTPGYQEDIGLMVMFSGSRPPGASGRGRGGRVLPRSVPAAGNRAAQRLLLRRQSRHLLFRDQQHRF